MEKQTRLKPFHNWKLSRAVHARALGKAMHNIRFVGEPDGTVQRAFRPSLKELHGAQRRAMLWAVWKARRDHGLPDDLSTFSVNYRNGKVTISPNYYGSFKSVTIEIPEWEEAGEIIILD